MSRLSLYVNEDGRTVLHYSGFSFLAGMVPVVWALHRRLYGIAALTLVYSIAYNYLVAGLTLGMQSAVYAVQVAVVGGLANRLHAYLLERRGWILTARELARTNEDSG
jgi:hypothetical protein